MNNFIRTKRAIESLLAVIEGVDSQREGLRDTPDRVARMYEEVFSGYGQDPVKVLQSQFNNDHFDEGQPLTSQMVIVKDIDFYSHCEHHMVPFFGKIHVGYIPGPKVVGISKIARVAQIFARRLQIQERLTNQIADTINDGIGAQGVMVIINAEHLCMKMRGIKNNGSSTTTSAIRGCFEKAECRNEFLSLVGLK